MKQNCRVLLICLLLAFLSLISFTSARFLPSKQGEKEVNGDGITQAIRNSNTEIEDVSNLMGSNESECDEEDEECLKRKMLAEAHLDYIYTQNHGKKP